MASTTRLETTLREYLAGNRSGRRCLAVPMATNAEVIGSISRVLSEDLADVVLLGPPEEIHEAAVETGADISSATIVDVAEPVDACRTAASMAAEGRVNALMKGLVQTADFVKAVLDRSFGLLPRGGLISHVAVVDVPRHHKLLLVTDAAINVSPGVQEAATLVRNAAVVAKSVGIDRPLVACVAPAEKVSDKVPSTGHSAALARLFADLDDGPVVEGPFGLDVAVSPEAAAIKGIGGEVPGRADIVLLPCLDAGNVLYKSLTVLAGASVAGVVAGAKVPIVLTSRADSEETKFLSILLSLLY
jgi:phosphate butyryltransferase